MAAPASSVTPSPDGTPASAGQSDWQRVTHLVQLSRALDDIEETRLVPERKVLYQFSARGHELA
jgi:2-oxoisovalerate dehydrogenase E1 component